MANNQQEILMDIRERLAKIEQHLKDMNGRLLKHDNILFVDCPAKHSTLNKDITQIKVFNGTVVGIATIIMVIVQLLF